MAARISVDEDVVHEQTADLEHVDRSDGRASGAVTAVSERGVCLLDWSSWAAAAANSEPDARRWRPL